MPSILSEFWRKQYSTGTAKVIPVTPSLIAPYFDLAPGLPAPRISPGNIIALAGPDQLIVGQALRVAIHLPRSVILLVHGISQSTSKTPPQLREVCVEIPHEKLGFLAMARAKWHIYRRRPHGLEEDPDFPGTPSRPQSGHHV